jgi:hypothetical protein
LTAALPRLVRAMDFLRRPSTPLPNLCAHKEWHHFLVCAPELLLLVNFSLSEEPRPDGRGERTVGRLKVLVRGASWDGDIDVFEAHELRAQAGRIDVAFGPHAIRFDGDRYRLSLALREHAIAVDLTLAPAAAPLLIQHVRLAVGKPLSWVMVPRLVAAGTVTGGGRVHRLDGAPAYHDHNWGYFGWGDDFTWEWGTALPAPTERWSVALVRTTDRARFRAGLQALYLWRGERLARIFRGDELSIVHEGAARPRAIFKVPRVMALLEPGSAVDVPSRVVVRGRAQEAELELVIDVIDLAQILMPDEEGLRSVTTLNQVFGRVRVDGQVGSERVRVDAPGVFEFIRATTRPVRGGAPARSITVDAAPDEEGPMLPIVADSLRALAAERPAELATLCALLAGRTLAIAVEGEPMAVSFDEGRVACARSAGPPAVRLRMRRALIADVIRARTSLAEALVDGRLEVTGPVDEIARLHEALLAYVHGAIRAPSFPALWQRFRALLAPEGT